MLVINNGKTMGNLILSGILDRFTKLKFVSVESGVGWIPGILETFDWQWRNGGILTEHPEYDLLPSEYFRRQIYGCFFRDRHGIEAIDVVGPDNVTFETDYPHTDSTWPDTKKVAEELMAGVPQDVVDKVMRTNAVRMLHLDL